MQMLNYNFNANANIRLNQRMLDASAYADVEY